MLLLQSIVFTLMSGNSIFSLFTGLGQSIKNYSYNDDGQNNSLKEI